MVEQVAKYNIGHLVNSTPLVGAIVPTARVPLVRACDVNLSGDVAVPHSAPGHGGDRIRIVVDAFEVPVHLRHVTVQVISLIGSPEIE